MSWLLPAYGAAEAALDFGRGMALAVSGFACRERNFA
jgi:hypothetical protein